MLKPQIEFLVRRYFDEVVNQRAFDVIEDIFSSDAFSQESVKAPLEELFEAFPDLMAEIEELMVEGDTASVRWVDRGTHEGTFNGIAPTGKKINLKGTSTFKVDGDKIVEGKSTVDFMDLIAQIGFGDALTDAQAAKMKEGLRMVSAFLGDADQDGMPDMIQAALEAGGVIFTSEKETVEPVMSTDERLEEVSRMFEAGLISKHEYEETKKQILGE